MKHIVVESDSYAENNVDSNEKDYKFKVGDHIRNSKSDSSFAKGYAPNWSEEVFVISKIKKRVPWTYVINYLNGEEIIITFYEKEQQKTNQKKFSIEKVIKKKETNYMPNEKLMIIHLIARLILN